MSLKDRIEECLKETGTKNVDLARAINSPRATVSDWVSGKTKSISVEKLFLAAQFFNIQPLWLGTGKKPKYYPGKPGIEEESNHYVIKHVHSKEKSELLDLINKTSSSGELSNECMAILSVLIKKMLLPQKGVDK